MFKKHKNIIPHVKLTHHRISLSIKRKLFIMFVVFLTITLIVALLAQIAMRSNREIVADLSHQKTQSVLKLEEFMRAMQRSEILIKHWVFIDQHTYSESKSDLVNLHTSIVPTIHYSLTQLSGKWNTKDKRLLDSTWTIVVNQIFPLHREIMDSLNNFGQYNNPTIIFYIESLIRGDSSQVMLATNRVYAKLHQLIENQKKYVKELNTAVDKSYIETNGYLVLFIVIEICIIAVFFFAGLRYFIKPVMQLNNATIKVSEGQLDTKVNIKSADEIGELARAFNNMTLKLQQQQCKLLEENAMKDRFLGIVGHDLMTPLGALAVNLKEVESKMSEVENQKIVGLIFDANTALERVKTLLNDLVTWGKIQMNKTDISPKSVDIKEVVDNTIELLGSIAEQKKINILNSVEEDLLAYIDKNSLSAIIRNLVANAIKFTPQGGNIIISAEEINPASTELQQASFVEVTVSDTGVGISPEIIAKLFKVDSKVVEKGTDGERGTGLGLVICKELIARSYGKIWVESVVNNGSSFKFIVPANRNTWENNVEANEISLQF